MTYFLSVFFGTFVLEDLALISSLALVKENKLSLAAAFFACFLGISMGDLGLYLLGSLAAQWKMSHRFKFFKKHRHTLEKMKTSDLLGFSIVISQTIPGTRVPVYVGAGFLGYPFLKFLTLTALSVFAWVLLAFSGGRSLQYFFADHWLLGLFFFLIFLALLKSLIPKLIDPWERKALLHSWRKWTHFEFWPASVFYIPIVFRYLYLSIKYRSLFMPFYASPHLAHGGLIGESKWDFLQHLSNSEPSTLKSLKISKELSIEDTRILLAQENIQYPFIIKPDVGQRGFGVRILRNETDLAQYLQLSPFDRIIQRLSNLPQEAGLFYVRKPNEEMGHIFSITDKRFPLIVGDGVHKLGDLILKDVRARIIAPIYFARLKERLDSVPAFGEVAMLSECGNHCQGAIFLNGKELITEELTLKLDQLAKKIPDFYFGRFDVRYENASLLKQGQSFEIVEINGAGSEATHIWDAKTSLREAYQTLFTQWALLFEIGHQVSKLPNKKTKVRLREFLKECAKVAFRKEPLSVSS